MDKSVRFLAPKSLTVPFTLYIASFIIGLPVDVDGFSPMHKAAISFESALALAIAGFVVITALTTFLLTFICPDWVHPSMSLSAGLIVSLVFTFALFEIKESLPANNSIRIIVAFIIQLCYIVLVEIGFAGRLAQNRMP